MGGLDPLTVYLAIRNPLMHRVKRERERERERELAKTQMEEMDRERERVFYKSEDRQQGIG